MSLVRYIVNLEEIFDELKEKINIDSGDIDTTNLERNLEKRLKEIMDLMNRIIRSGKIAKSKSLNKNIPALINDFVISHTFETDIYLCGLTFSQSAWKIEDSFSLEVGGVLLFDRISTKEVAQYKHLNAFYPVPKNTEVKIIYHNASGNSKIVWFDFDYLEGGIQSPIEDEITHDYDYKIELQWEYASNADLDLHCILDCDKNKHIYYMKKIYGEEPDKVWLDYDYVNHTSTGKPEILTILGQPCESAQIYIKNYNKGTLSKPVTLKIFKKEKLYKTFTLNHDDLTDENRAWYICNLNIKTGEVTGVMHEIPYLTGSQIDLSSCRL